MHSLIDRLWNSSPGSISRGIKRRLTERQRPAGWNQIKGGTLKGAELFLPPGGTVWEEMMAGNYDQFLYDALLPKHNPAGAVVWDIGAHVGYHSLAFAALGAEVSAFEPNRVNFERLQLNVTRNTALARRVKLVSKAVCDADGQMSFSQNEDLKGGSMGGHLERALPPLEQTAYTDAGFHDTLVPTVRIDTLVASGEKPPGILKIDVEGAEELVLRGGGKFLPERRPVLLMEIHHICLMFSIQRLLTDWGYSLKLLDQAHASASRCFLMAEPRS